MAALRIKAVRRQAENGRLQVQTNGGWMNWTMVGTSQQTEVSRMPELKYLVTGDDYDTDPFTRGTFLHVLGVTPAPIPRDENAPEPNQGEGEQGEGMPEPQLKGEPTEGKPKFQMPGEGEGEGEGPTDDLSAVRQDPEEGMELVPFDEAFKPRGEALGQAVMDQTLEVSNRNIAEATKALAEDMLDHITNVEKGLLDNVTKQIAEMPKGDGGGVIVKIVLNRINVPDTEIEGIAHKQMPKLLKLVSIGQHIYLPGPPGTGKSHAAEQVTKSLGWRYASLSFGPTTPESRLWGGMDANGKFHEPPFVTLAKYARDNPDSGSLFCADELDNAHPGIFATLNSAMANGWFTTPEGEFVSWGNNFVVIGCANTYGTGPTAEFSGRNRMDAATLDRFAYLPWDTDTGVEKALVKAQLAETPKGDFIAEDWLKLWYATREKVAANGLKIFVTMRGAINGAKMLAAGMGVRDVWMAVLGDKVPDDQRRKINPL